MPSPSRMRTFTYVSPGATKLTYMHLPADSSAGHCGYDSGLQATEITPVAFPLVNDLGRLEQARDGPQFSVASASSCLQECLDDVQGRGERRSKTTCQSSGKAMRIRVVAAGGVHDLRYRFVRHELQRGEGHCHA